MITFAMSKICVIMIVMVLSADKLIVMMVTTMTIRSVMHTTIYATYSYLQ